MSKNRKTPELWEQTKFISWPYSQANPVVRIPTPSGTPESKTIRFEDSEQATFARCLEYRNLRGPQIWGENRWDEILKVTARSVARNRKKPAGPRLGVYSYDEGQTRGWTCCWYELLEDNTRKRRSKTFTYTGRSPNCKSNSEALLKAMKLREQMEARWYSVTGLGERRVVSSLPDFEP